MADCAAVSSMASTCTEMYNDPALSHRQVCLLICAQLGDKGLWQVSQPIYKPVNNRRAHLQVTKVYSSSQCAWLCI